MTDNDLERQVSDWRRRGITVSVRGNRLRAEPWRSLSEHDIAFFRQHRCELKSLVSRGPRPAAITPEPHAPSLAPMVEKVITPPAQSPEPVVLVGDHRVTEDEVRGALLADGDETLADYLEGRISQADAYAATASRLRHAQRVAFAIAELRR